jgi:hypothetical protein
MEIGSTPLWNVRLVDVAVVIPADEDGEVVVESVAAAINDDGEFIFESLLFLSSSIELLELEELSSPLLLLQECCDDDADD